VRYCGFNCYAEKNLQQLPQCQHRSSEGFRHASSRHGNEAPWAAYHDLGLRPTPYAAITDLKRKAPMVVGSTEEGAVSSSREFGFLRSCFLPFCEGPDRCPSSCQRGCANDSSYGCSWADHSPRHGSGLPQDGAQRGLRRRYPVLKYKAARKSCGGSRARTVCYHRSPPARPPQPVE